ncbi:hypothetical protein Tco_1089326 [Tanacetum coccineum]
MTRSTVKKLTEPLEEPEREFHRRTKVAYRQQQNESLAIAERNLFDDEASSSANTEPKPLSSSKSVREHSSPNSDGFQNPIVLHVEQTGNIVESRDIWLIQGDMILRFQQGTNEPIKDTWIRFQDLIWQVPHHGIQKWLLVQIFHDNISPEDRGKLDQYAHFRFSSLNEEEGWNCIEEYVQYQDDLWDDPPPPIGKLEKSIAHLRHLRGRSSWKPMNCDSNKPREQTIGSKNALADLGASINLMLHSLFLRLDISELKPTRMSIQLVDRSVKYPIGLCTDSANFTRKRPKPDKHEHENGKECTRAGDLIAKHQAPIWQKETSLGALIGQKRDKEDTWALKEAHQ